MFSPHLFRIFVSENSPPKLNEKCRLDDSHSIQVPPLLHPDRCHEFARPQTLRSGSKSSDLRKRQVRKVTDNTKVTSVLCRIIRFGIISVSVLLLHFLTFKRLAVLIIRSSDWNCKEVFKKVTMLFGINCAYCDCEHCFKLWVYCLVKYLELNSIFMPCHFADIPYIMCQYCVFFVGG